VAKRVLTVGVVLGMLLGVYLVGRQTVGRAPSEKPIDGRPVEQRTAPAAAPAQPIVATATRYDGDHATERSLEQRSTAIKGRIGKAIASRYRDQYVEILVNDGLSPADSVNIVQTLFEALAECHFAATRQRLTDRNRVRQLRDERTT
jgi:hypothetical protein